MVVSWWKSSKSSLKREKNERKEGREIRKEEAFSTGFSLSPLHFLKKQQCGMGFTSGSVTHPSKIPEVVIFGFLHSQRGDVALGVARSSPTLLTSSVGWDVPLTSPAVNGHRAGGDWSTYTVTRWIPATVPNAFTSGGGACNLAPEEEQAPRAAMAALMGLQASSPDLMRRWHIGLPAPTRKPFWENGRDFNSKVIFLWHLCPF